MALSTTWAAETGQYWRSGIANNAPRLLTPASGILDGGGNRVFKISSLSFVYGATLVSMAVERFHGSYFNFTPIFRHD